MKNLIIVDGNNFFYKAKFDKKLRNVNGEPVYMIYGFFRNMIALMKKFNIMLNGKKRYVVCWDGGYSKRLHISEKAVLSGIIPKTYKQDRREKKFLMTEEEKELSNDEQRQKRILQNMMKLTFIDQQFIEGEEADDLTASICKKYHHDFDRFVIVTTDEDYYQLLDIKTYMFKHKASDSTMYGLSEFQQETGLATASQWVDVCAISGDDGDTIPGAYGIGPKKALPFIIQHGTLDNLMKHLTETIEPYVLKYGSDENVLNELKDKKNKLPFNRNDLTVYQQLEKVKISYELKKMDSELPVELHQQNPEPDELYEHFREQGFNSLLRDLGQLTGESESDSTNISKIVSMVTGTSLFGHVQLNKNTSTGSVPNVPGKEETGIFFPKDIPLPVERKEEKQEVKKEPVYIQGELFE